MKKKTVWRVPRAILKETEKALASKQAEVFTLWTAPLADTGNIITVSRLVVPKQISKVTALGCYVRIDGKELSRIAFDNYDKGEWNVAQIHTHPSSNVTISQLDREWEVVSHSGALSIIVPSYCHKGLASFEGVNFYEKQGLNWKLLQTKDVSRRLSVIQ